MPVDLTKFERLYGDTDLAGRTIKAADIGSDEVSISFTDGAFLHAMVEGNDDDGMYLDWEVPVYAHTYHSLELITAPEFMEMKAAEKAACEAKAAEIQRAEYEKLKAKFEPTS